MWALALLASVALCLANCGGKSSHSDSAAAGQASQATGGQGASAGSGGAVAGEAAAPTSGGSPTSSGGIASGGATVGGSSPGCSTGETIALEARDCKAEADCEARILTSCCGQDRVVGVAKAWACSAVPPDCAAVDCVKLPGLVADDGQKVLDPSQIRVACQVGEPGAGLCSTFVADDGASTCGANECAPGELCVHLGASGGPAPPCHALPDDGVCPAGTEYVTGCQSGTPGCRELPVTPEPHCAPIPAGCGAPAACACLPPGFCNAPQVCSTVTGRHVYCLDLTP